MALKQIKSLVQFARGTSVVLNGLVTPIPDNVVIYSIDDGVFKLGDGVTTYSNLPIMFTYAELISAQGGISGKFDEPTLDQNGKIVIVKYDQVNNIIKFGVSDTSLQSITDAITGLETVEANQSSLIADIFVKALSIDENINTANDNNIIVVNSNRYSSSGQTLATVQAQIDAQATYVPGSHLEDVMFYTSTDKTIRADKLNLSDGNTYYVDIIGFNNNETSVVYGLTAANANVVISQVSGSLFSIQLNNLVDNAKTNTPFVLIASINNASNTSKVEKAIACLAVNKWMLAGVYGGTSSDTFYDVVGDSSGNIYAVGSTNSEGAAEDALIIKFDDELNIVTRKIFSNSVFDIFYGVDIDSSGNVYAVGITDTYGLVIKYNNDLTVMSSIHYGSGIDRFRKIAIDASNNIYVVGSTDEGNGPFSAIIIKFTTALAISARKTYSGSESDHFYDVAVDSSGNVYAVGSTNSEGVGATTYSSAFIVKFDSSLNIVVKKVYSGSASDYFQGVTVDTSGNVYAVGVTASEGAGNNDALIVKFDSSLNKVAAKVYGGAYNDIFNDIFVNTSGELCIVGTIVPDASGFQNGVFMKFSSDLSTVTKNVVFGGSSDESALSMFSDASNNVYVVGKTSSEGAGSDSALICKFVNGAPVGTFSGTILSGLTFTDSAQLTSANSGLTLAISGLTLSVSTTSLATISAQLTESTLQYELDVIN